jgi:hypothetical protein
MTVYFAYGKRHSTLNNNPKSKANSNDIVTIVSVNLADSNDISGHSSLAL